MRRVAEIKASYDWLRAGCLQDADAARESGDWTTLSRMKLITEVLDRSIYVTLFGRFESAVTDWFEQARDTRVSNPDWRGRRGWDVAALRDRRVPFETKLAMVLDRATPAYREVLHAYGLRNHFAHGGDTEPAGSIDELVGDLFRWQGLLRR